MRDQAQSLNQLGSFGKLLPTVAAVNLFTIAYDLFVIADNTSLRERLLKSLRVADQFHGARYELMIAACLIRGGFAVEFSDEDQIDKRHSDLTAHHRRSGRRYSAEIKAKGRSGLLGKPTQGSARRVMGRDVSRLLRKAFSKPADHERLIFIDMNLPPASSRASGNEVSWQNDAIASIQAVQRQPGKLPVSVFGFVVFTNSPSYHMAVDEIYVGVERAFTGFNKPHFAEELPMLDDAYPEIADLFDAFGMHHVIPDEFKS